MKTAAGNFFELENFVGLLPGLVRHSILETAKQVEIGGQELCRRLCTSPLIGLGEWLRREIGVVCRGCQGQVKLGGPAAQQRGRIEIGADSLPGFIRDRLTAQATSGA